MDEITKQKNQEILLAKKEADRIYAEKQQLKAQKYKEESKRLKDFLATQMVMYLDTFVWIVLLRQ